MARNQILMEENEMKKSILVVHGDKGGIGKSTYAGLAIDYLIKRAHGTVIVIEGDKKIDDVARRYQGVDDVNGMLVDLARPDFSEEAILALFEEIERAGGTHVVINLPASASSTIDAQAEIVMTTVRNLGYEIYVAWLIGRDADSATLAGESALCREADKKIAVLNEKDGNPEKFPWYESETRKKWLESGGMEGILPCLTERVAIKVRALPGRYSDLEKSPELYIVERSSVFRWVRKAWEGVIAPLYESEAPHFEGGK